MNKIAIATVLTVACGAFAWDEYAPVAKSKTEVDLMATYDIKPEAGNFKPSLQVKYGIIDGLDVEVADVVSTDPEFGFNKPNLAFKYSDAGTGLGGFLAMDFPVASEKLDADPKASYYFAFQYLKTFDKIVLNDWILYNNTFETGNDGVLDFYLKPQCNVTDKIGPYLGLEYTTSGKFDGYVLAAKPGINVIINDIFSVEANIPVAKTKDVDDLYVGAYVGFYGVF